MSQGTVFNIQRFTTHDGPGIRTTVFLKGCPLECWWCHNPESKEKRPTLLYDDAQCLRCGLCIMACEQKAITMADNRMIFDTSRCTLCGSCHKRCPAEAVELVGKVMTSEAVLAEIEKDRIFYDESGGGATFSGGEPLLQAEFLEGLLRACKDRGIHTAVDTSGQAPWQVLEEISEWTDIFLYDLKHMDSTMHQRLTGVPNNLILDNLKRLAKVHQHTLLRIPIIPGLNDDSLNLLATGHLAMSLGITKVHILPYHSSGIDKYGRLGEEYRLPGTKPPAHEHMEQIAGTLSSLGLSVIIGG